MQRSIALTLILCLVVAGAVPPATAATQHGSDATTPRSTDAPATALLAAQASQNNTTVTILSYNDVQTAAAENATLPRMVTLINQRRAAHDNPTFVVGGGDEVSPHALSPLSAWRVPVEALNVLDPDVDVIGNHDLDYGFEAVANFSDASTYPWVMANVVDAETGEPIPGTKPYHVVERGGVRVGVVGVADEKIKSKTAVDFAEEGYELRNYSAVASKYATHLKENESVDVVVVAAHLGVPVAKDLANATEHVDVVVVGDDEIEYPPQETGGAVIMEAEARAEHVAELNLTVADGEVTAWDGRLLDVTENVSKNETVSRIITEERKQELGKRAGRTEVELDARFDPNYHDETALGNMIGDSFRAQSGADVAVTNAGGIRSNSVYGPGNLTVGDVYNMLPFQNTLVTLELTGAELQQLLASQVVTLDSDEGQQYGSEAKLQVSGVTYEWVGHSEARSASNDSSGQSPREEADEQIRDVWVNGDPLDENATYTVTVNSYMAGWDQLEDEPVVEESHMLYGTALLKYVRANSPVSPTAEDRIRRVNAEVEPESVDVREGNVTISLPAPADAESVGDFHATTGNASERLAAESVAFADGAVAVTFDAAALQRLAAAGGAAQLYGEYNSSAYDRVYFEHSVLNANVEASDFAARETTATTAERPETSFTTAAATTEEAAMADATTATASDAEGDAPGFTPITAVAALLGAALVALRRA